MVDQIGVTETPGIEPVRLLRDVRAEGARMTARRIIGILLIIVGIVALIWGGIFWTDRDTVVDAGPIEIATEDREGVEVPPVAGVIALIGGIALVAWPASKRV
jgi:drug/metabolite transporter (DMT)-like permease